MPDISIILMVGMEIAVAVLALVGLLLLRTRSLSRTAAALEQKVVDLRQKLKELRDKLKIARAEAAQAQSVPDYAEFIDAQINATRNHHLALNADRDIVLDMGVDTPVDRRAASLRHAFLIAEKEAWLAGEDDSGVDWSVLASKLGQIIQFYEQAAAAAPAGTDTLDALDLDAAAPAEAGELAALREVVDNQKRHIENLERFKKLFFDADAKWHQATREAEQYRKELLEQSKGFNAGDEFNSLLERYSQVYNDFGATLTVDRDTPRVTQVIEINADRPSVGSIVIANQEELQRLRNMAVDQHKMIQHLRQELESAHSIEEKDRVIAELHKQLERHERFLKESDICTKQLEDELERVMEDNHTLKMKVLAIKQEAEPAAADPTVEQMANIIEDFTRQSSEMLNALEMLEAECSELREQLAAGSGAAGAEADAKVEALKRQLATAQQELLNLQTQHIELEERYLELKTASL